MLLHTEELVTTYRIKGLPYPAVKGVSLRISEGSALGLAGESGCGKTTLGNALMRILPREGNIESGHIWFEGRDLVQLPEREMRNIRWQSISMVFQGAMNAFNPVLSVRQQIAEAMIIHTHASKQEANSRSDEMLDLVGIDPSLGTSYPHEFSGGMKQRACIAMALVLNPKVVIADEPTTALDVMIQAQILRLLRSIQNEFNTGMVLISHDLGVLAENCEQLFIMYAGRVVEEGFTEAILRRPQHPYTQGLLSCVPRFGGSREIGPAIRGSPPSLMSPPAGCGFEPRCPKSISECKDSVPGLEPIEEGHLVACYKVELKQYV